MNAETSRTFRRDQKWRGSWKFQDRNRPKDSRPRFAPRPCRRMTVPKKITEPLKFTTMNDRVKEKAESYPNFEKLEFLPFHKLCMEKYDRLGLEFPLKNPPAMNPEKLKEMTEKL